MELNNKEIFGKNFLITYIQLNACFENRIGWFLSVNLPFINVKFKIFCWSCSCRA